MMEMGVDFAFNRLTQSVHVALEFSRLPDEEIAKLRYDFICCECRQDGYYRKRSISGRNPCFGAKHLEDCPLAVRSEDPWGEEGDDAVQRLEADNTRIVLGMGDEDGGEDDGEAKGGERERKGGGRRFAKGGDAARTQIQRNADKLLRWLIAAPTFKTSGLIISTPAGDVPVHDFFVEIIQADPNTHSDTFRGFWGVLTRTNTFYGVQVFNGAARPALGFEVGPALARKIEEKYSLSSITELVGRTVLFMGSPRRTQSDSFMMDVSSKNYVGVLPSDFDTP